MTEEGASRRATPQQFQRETNLALVLKSLRDDGPASRSELAERIGIDRSTMTSIAGELLDAGLVSEGDAKSAGARGGRRARLLAIDARRVVAAGVELRESAAEWVVCSISGVTVHRGTIERPTEVTGATDWIRHAFSSLIATLAGPSGPARGALVAGVGLGVPGVVEPATRVLRESIVFGPGSFDLDELWTQAAALTSPAPTDLPTLLVDNDANCGAWNLAEERPDATTIYVQVSLHRGAREALRPSLAGIGLSFVVDGRVYSGSSNAAGELRGYRWRAGDADQLGLHEVDRSSVEVALGPLTDELLLNLGVIASAIDPGRIVIGGDFAGRSELLDGGIRERLASSAIGPYIASGALRIAARDEYPISSGAARMVLHELFALPTVHDATAGGGWQRVLARLRGPVYTSSVLS